MWSLSFQTTAWYCHRESIHVNCTRKITIVIYTRQSTETGKNTTHQGMSLLLIKKYTGMAWWNRIDDWRFVHTVRLRLRFIFSKRMGCMGFSVVVASTPCEYLHWISFNLFDAVKIRGRNLTVWTALQWELTHKLNSIQPSSLVKFSYQKDINTDRNQSCCQGHWINKTRRSFAPPDIFLQVFSKGNSSKLVY